jgi:hypothetical protein
MGYRPFGTNKNILYPCSRVWQPWQWAIVPLGLTKIFYIKSTTLNITFTNPSITVRMLAPELQHRSTARHFINLRLTNQRLAFCGFAILRFP